MNLVLIKLNSRHSGKLKVVKLTSYSSLPRPFRILEIGQRFLSYLFPEDWSRCPKTLLGSRESLCNKCSSTIVTYLQSKVPITISICCYTLVRLAGFYDCVVVFSHSFQLSRKMKLLRVFHAQIENLKISMSGQNNHPDSFKSPISTT